MRRFLRSIRFRIVAIYLAVILLAFFAVGSLVSGLVANFLVRQRTSEQTNTTLEMAERLPEILEGQNVPAHLYREAAGWLKQQGGDGRLLFLDNDAVVQMDTASLYNGYRLPYREVRDILVLNRPSSVGFHRINTFFAGGEAFLTAPSVSWVVYYTAPVQASEGTTLGVLLYAVPIQEVVDSVWELTMRMALVFLAFALAVGFVSLLLSGWLTRPIVTLTNAIRRVGTQGYSERVHVRGKDELSELSDAFNIMSEKLEKHDKLRNEFVSNASHELKTPLSAMKILSETMLYQEEFQEEMAKEFFEDINHEVDRLTQIINDLLQLVHEESVEQALHLTEVEYMELVQRVIKRLLPLAKQKGIRLEKRLTPMTVWADAPRLEQVVSNLIDNALKYTDKGSVAVTLKQDGAYALLTVHDTGIGIPKESIPRLFERFYRVDKARSRDTGGTGLGLSIVERIIASHGGYINVESAVGHGTTFLVYMPMYVERREGGEP